MKTLVIGLIVATLATPALAADAPAKKASWSTWLEQLKSSLSNSAVSGQQKRGRNATAVAAVRGEDQAKKSMADPDMPTLRGSSKEGRAKKEMELNAKFESAVNLLIDKKYEDGIAALEALKKEAPKFKSGDVDQALAGAKEELAAKNNGPVVDAPKKP
jgi:hypothetical protein